MHSLGHTSLDVWRVRKQSPAFLDLAVVAVGLWRADARVGVEQGMRLLRRWRCPAVPFSTRLQQITIEAHTLLER